MLKNAILAAAIGFGCVQAAECADRFALVTIVNTSNQLLTFSYQVGPTAWQNVGLLPGHSFVVASPFSAPGSYVYPLIHLAYDADLHPGFVNTQVFLPVVQYSPVVDARLGSKYFYDYDGPSGRFVAMFGPN